VLAFFHFCTDAEVQIARLAAAGRANREISAELFLSIRAVEKALTTIYQRGIQRGGRRVDGISRRHVLSGQLTGIPRDFILADIGDQPRDDHRHRWTPHEGQVCV
jgi:Bacterial regulatory proteins, luxR family